MLKERKNLARVCAIHVGLLEEGNFFRHVHVVLLDKCENLFMRAGLLRTELITRERKHFKPPRTVLVD